MRTLRVSLVGAVTLALLGGLGQVALAQGDVLDRVERLAGDGEVYTIESFKVISEDDSVYIHAKEASDPRLSGTWTEFWDCADYQRGDIEVCVGSVRVENEGGTWLGRTEGFWAAPEPVPWSSVPHGFQFTMLEGQGDYAGLTVLHQDTWNSEEGLAAVGVIFEGALPPVPGPAE